MFYENVSNGVSTQVQILWQVPYFQKVIAFFTYVFSMYLPDTNNFDKARLRIISCNKINLDNRVYLVNYTLYPIRLEVSGLHISAIKQSSTVGQKPNDTSPSCHKANKKYTVHLNLLFSLCT